MGYAEDYLKAKESNQTVCLTTVLIQWNKPGIEIFGKIVAISDFEDTQYEEKVNKYLAETDDGDVSFILGQARDAEYKDSLIPGACFRILFLGKKPTKSNKQFNEFVIEVWNIPEKKVKNAKK